MENEAINKDDIITEVNKHIVDFKNEFPAEALPLSIQQIIKATNESLNFPLDFIGASMLYAISVAIGNTHKVQIAPSFQESALIYIAIVARAGTNKSHPLHFALQPIMDHDAISYGAFEVAMQLHEQDLTLSKKEREDAGKGDPIKPVWKKYLLSDFTPEALAHIHKHNKRGIGVYADELAGWLKNLNRYNNGSAMEFWLSAWNSKPITIDRKSSEPILIQLPYVPVGGTIQNGLLIELAKDNRSQNGFIDRILFVIPENVKKEYWSETEINSDVKNNWQNIINKLLEMPLQLDETFNPQPEVLHFSPDAKNLLFEWQIKNTDQCNSAETEALGGIFSKMDMYVARLALIIEMMRYACGEGNKQNISIEATRGAVLLVEYFKKSAIKVNSIISNYNPLDRLPGDKRMLYEALPETFTLEIGMSIAENFKMPERTFNRFLTEKALFKRISRGTYEKQI